MKPPQIVDGLYYQSAFESHDSTKHLVNITLNVHRDTDKSHKTLDRFRFRVLRRFRRENLPFSFKQNEKPPLLMFFSAVVSHKYQIVLMPAMGSDPMGYDFIKEPGPAHDVFRDRNESTFFTTTFYPAIRAAP
ncbi:MAG: hypothetical protein ABIJ56_09060 [Pseudomonadota bacterium]